jgi:hypothetical protein
MVLFEEKGDDYTLASSCPHLGKAAKDFFEDTQTWPFEAGALRRYVNTLE